MENQLIAIGVVVVMIVLATIKTSMDVKREFNRKSRLRKLKENNHDR